MKMIWILQLVLIPALSPLFIGITNKTKAFLQNRKGSSIIQPYRDIWKLLHKDEVISGDTSWISQYAPYIVYAVTLVVGASIPLFGIFGSGSTSDFLLVVYTLSIGTFFLALAGLDSGGPFGGFGSSREMTFAALSEGGLIFSLLTVVLVSGKMNLFGISKSLTLTGSHSSLAIFLAFAGFVIVMLAESARFPFDNPDTHLELTMIHEAMILEFSGKRLALMEWASANKQVIFMAIAVNVFLPWGLVQTLSLTSVLTGLAFFVLKVSMMCLAIGVLESTIAKFRFFRLPDLLFLSIIFNVIAIGLMF